MKLRLHHARILDLRFKSGSGTEIIYSTRLPIFALVFLVVWFGLAILIGGVLLVSVLLGSLEGNREAVVLGVPLMLAGAFTLVALDWFMSRHDEKYLLDFVCYMLDAERRPV